MGVKKVLIRVGVVTTALLLVFTSALGGDRALLSALPHLTGRPMPQVQIISDSVLAYLGAQSLPVDESPYPYYKREFFFSRYGLQGNARGERYDIKLRQCVWFGGPHSESKSAFEVTQEGFAFLGIRRLHDMLNLVLLDPSGSEISNLCLNGLNSHVLGSCLSLHGNLILYNWWGDPMFVEVRTDGSYSTLKESDEDLRKAYHKGGSMYLNEPSFITMPRDGEVILGNHMTDISKGTHNQIPHHNLLGLCAYDIEADSLLRRNEIDLIHEPAAQKTNVQYSHWRVFSDEQGTTIYGPYRDEADATKLFILTVDNDLNPVGIAARRVERFEDAVDFDRSQPHHDFYMFDKRKDDGIWKIWMTHIIVTSDVIYHAEYDTLRE